MKEEKLCSEKNSYSEREVEKMLMFQMSKVGKTISAARKAANMTQMELADQLGISFQAVSNWEGGGFPNLKIPH